MKQKNSKHNYIYRNFLLALKDIKKLKTYFIFSLTIFLLFTIIGLVFPTFFTEKILELIKDLINQTRGLSTLELISFITSNNIQVAFFGMIFGILLGILPFLALVVNGYVLGFVANQAIAIDGIFVLWRLLPHGIFEIPAILISTALGIRLGTDLKNIKKNFISSIRIFLLIVIPLLVIAGLIEGLFIGLAS
jgi:stage II sporulation protein M